MSRSKFSQLLAPWCALALLLPCALTASAAGREDCDRRFKPQIWQPGKDVVWLPTSDSLTQRMLQMAKVTAADRVYDLGAGDGKIAIAAARDFGAQAVGVEYDPTLAQLGQCYVEAERLGGRVRIVQGDIFETDFSSATVVTLYLLPELNLRLRPTILKMKPGTRVVSHSFRMDDWEPDERSMSDDDVAYLWVVPANVAGNWSFREAEGSGQLAVQLTQKFQELDGRANGEPLLSNARVRGVQVDFAFVENAAATKVSGRVAGDRMDATVTRGGKTSSYVGARTGR
jgi:SAM-dependent methyltransferase